MADILKIIKNLNVPVGLTKIYEKLNEIIHVVNVAVANIAGNSSGISDLQTQIDALTPNYKIYVALLTETAPATGIAAGPLEIGRLYEIEAGNTTGIFTNVGAANNNPGTQFIATGTTPTAFGDGTLESFGEPVAIVSQNTLDGDPVWTRRLQGIYDADLAGKFVIGKTHVMIGKTVNGGADYTIYQVDVNQIEIVTESFNAAGPSFDATDGLLAQTSIEIKVYN